jgi:hypothetical protein
MSYRDDDQDLLKDPDKGVREARGILTGLWRQLLVMRDIDAWRWDKLMRKYLADPRNGIRNNSRDLSSARGNLNKELKRDDMTFRVFLKALSFIDPIRVVFSVKVTFANGRTYTVSAKLKDRGELLTSEHLNEAPPDTDDNVLDEIDGMTCSEHRPSFDTNPHQPRYTAEEMIEALRNRNK